MDIGTLTINEAREIAALVSGAAALPATPVSGNQIVVLDRGFVYVGDVSREGDLLIIRNAKNIRSWGTTKGLGELRGGPLSGTKTDDAGTVRVPFKAVIHLIEVEASKW